MDIDKLLEANSKDADKLLKEFLPEKASKGWLTENFGDGDFDKNAFNEFLCKPLLDLLGRGGKRWRPLLLLLSCGAVGGNPARIRRFGIIPELIHNGTLVIDDIEDDSDTRRGAPTMHRKYGIDIAVNLGCTLYYLPLQIIKKSSLDAQTREKIYELVNEELLNLHAGQGTDISWHRKMRKISERQYFTMCANKTGTLARLAARMGGVLGKGNEEQINALGKFAERIGIAFQIQDDILNLEGGLGKKIGEDITEGKLSLPVIHALEVADSRDSKKLTDILKSHTRKKEEIQDAIQIIRKNGCLTYSTAIAAKIVDKAWKDLEYMLPASEYKNQLKQIADFMTQRKF